MLFSLMAAGDGFLGLLMADGEEDLKARVFQSIWQLDLVFLLVFARKLRHSTSFPNALLLFHYSS